MSIRKKKITESPFPIGDCNNVLYFSLFNGIYFITPPPFFKYSTNTAEFMSIPCKVKKIDPMPKQTYNASS